MITHYDFLLMTETEQAEAVWQGNLIGDRVVDEETVQLYSLGSFYVEVFYRRKDNRISRFHAFTNNSFLIPYIKEQMVKF